MDFLKKLVGVAKQVKDAIEDVSDASSASSESASASAASTPEGGSTPDGYQRHLDNGFTDPRKLLTRTDAAKALGSPVSDEGATGWDEEWFSVEYHADGETTHRVRLDVSTGMPWDYIATEVASTPVDGIGDEALRDGSTLYVRSGDVIFWVHGDRLSEAVIEAAARDAVDRA